MFWLFYSLTAIGLGVGAVLNPDDGLRWRRSLAAAFVSAVVVRMAWRSFAVRRLKSELMERSRELDNQIEADSRVWVPQPKPSLVAKAARGMGRVIDGIGRFIEPTLPWVGKGAEFLGQKYVALGAETLKAIIEEVELGSAFPPRLYYYVSEKQERLREKVRELDSKIESQVGNSIWFLFGSSITTLLVWSWMMRTSPPS